MITPPQFRGQISAVYYMAISITGLTARAFHRRLALGLVQRAAPEFAGMDALVEWVLPGATGTKSLALAFAAVPLLYGSVVLALAPVTLRNFRRELVRIRAS